ncbi:Ig-like domain-containing protein [Haloglomus halophilum]|uniref:Ig-like domain-containing protein n=1 Tax=Haloglomus halophilum TaxID=2962672 RepID=UPI0020CA14AF|nr:Ig-like domain-containing protein [Haloglomus halophilum]
MVLRGDNRGQSEVIGAVFVFGFVVLLLGLNQTVLVPQANAEIEFQHSKEVEGDMANLRNNIQQASSLGEGQSTRIKLGPRYPARYLAINPASPSGSLRTVDPGSDLSLKNVEATNPETQDYIGDSSTGTTSPAFPTRALIYRPSYNFHSQSPEMVIENSVFYRKFEDADTITSSEQTLVSGKSINLIGIEGDFREASTDSVSVDIKTLSASSNRVLVQESGTGRVQVSIQTRLSEEKWVGTLLSDEIDSTDSGATECADLDPSTTNDDGRFIVDCDYTGSGEFKQLTIFMEKGTEYSVKLTKLGIGSQTSDPEKHYITVVRGEQTSVPEGGTGTFTVEARDKFNNPVSGVSLDAGAESSDVTVSAVGNDITDEQGQVTFLIESTSDISGISQDPKFADVTFGSSTPGDPGFTPGKKENAEVEFKVQNTDSSGLGPTSPFTINPAGSGTVFLNGTDATGKCPNTKGTPLTVTFNNSGSQPREWERGRISFWSGSQNKNNPVSVFLEDNSSDGLVVTKPFETLQSNPTFDGNEETPVLFCIDSSKGGGTLGGDFFILQVEYGNGPINTYFVYVP